MSTLTLKDLNSDSSATALAEVVAKVLKDLAEVGTRDSTPANIARYKQWADSADIMLGNVLHRTTVANDEKFWHLMEMPVAVAAQPAKDYLDQSCWERRQTLEHLHGAAQHAAKRWDQSDSQILVLDTGVVQSTIGQDPPKPPKQHAPPASSEGQGEQFVGAPRAAWSTESAERAEQDYGTGLLVNYPWRENIGAAGFEDVRLVIPLAVLQELDRNKRHTNSVVRGQASRAIRWIDRHIQGLRHRAILVQGGFVASAPDRMSGTMAGGLSIEFYIDPDDRKTDDTDFRIIMATHDLAGQTISPTQLGTLDTSMRTLAEAADVKAHKLDARLPRR